MELREINKNQVFDCCEQKKKKVDSTTYVKHVSIRILLT